MGRMTAGWARCASSEAAISLPVFTGEPRGSEGVTEGKKTRGREAMGRKAAVQGGLKI